MTQQVRKGYRNHKKGTWAAVLVVLVAAALAIVLPALGSSTTPDNGVAPASADQGVYPSLLSVGGSNFSCTKAGTSYASPSTPTDLVQYQISKPTPGEYRDAATGVTFVIEAPPAGSGLDPKSHFSFSVKGGAALVYHVGVNGGTKTVWYDYANNPVADSATPSGVNSDSNLHSTPDSKYSATSTPPNYTFYTASITTFCYRPLTVSPSCVNPFGGNALGGTAGSVEYTARLVSPDGSSCKTDKVVMYSYTSGDSELFATLNPVTQGTGTQYRVIERIRWSGISSDSQNLVADLWYDDIPPYDGETEADRRDLKMCKFDARSTADPFDLPRHPTTNQPLYSNEDILPEDETSCLFQGSDSAGTSPTNRIFEAWIYAKFDGARGNFVG